MTRPARTLAALLLAALALPALTVGAPGSAANPGNPGSPGDGPRHHDHDHGRDRDRDHDRGKDRGDRGRPLSDAEIDLALTTLHEINPEEAKELRAFREKNPDAIDERLRKQFPRLRDFLALKERDERMFDLRVQDIKLWRQSRGLAKAVADARVAEDNRKADDLADDLEKLAEQHFEIRQQIRQRELEKLEAQLDRLRDQLEEREDDKNDLIEQHVKKLIRGDRSEW